MSGYSRKRPNGIFTDGTFLLVIAVVVIVVWMSSVNRLDLDFFDMSSDMIIIVAMFIGITSVVAIFAGFCHKYFYIPYVRTNASVSRESKTGTKNLDSKNFRSSLTRVYGKKINILKRQVDEAKEKARIARRLEMKWRRRLKDLEKRSDKELQSKNRKMRMMQRSHLRELYKRGLVSPLTPPPVPLDQNEVKKEVKTEAKEEAKEEKDEEKETVEENEESIPLPRIPSHHEIEIERSRSTSPTNLTMNVLQWNKIEPSKVHNTIWIKENLYDKDPNIELDREYLIELFKRSKPRRRFSEIPNEQFFAENFNLDDSFEMEEEEEEEEEGEGEGNEKRKYLSVLRNNYEPISVFVRKLGNEYSLSINEFINYINRFNEDVITVQLQENLNRILHVRMSDFFESPASYSQDEEKEKRRIILDRSIRMLQGYSDDESLLMDADHFILKLFGRNISTNNFIREKLLCWIVKRKHTIYLEEKTQIIEKCIKDLKQFSSYSSSKNSWTRILQILLSIGNFINEKTKISQLSHGFHFDSSNIEMFTRSYCSTGVSKLTGKKITLIQYLVEFISEKYPELNEFLRDMKSIDRLRKVKFTKLYSEILEYGNILEVVKKSISFVNEYSTKEEKDEELNNSQQFLLMMKNEGFFGKSSKKPYQEYNQLIDLVNQSKLMLANISELYGVSINQQNQTPIEEFFSNISNFCFVYGNELEEFRKVIYSKKKLEEKKRKKKQLATESLKIQGTDENEDDDDEYFDQLSPKEKKKHKKQRKKKNKKKKKKKKAKMKKSLSIGTNLKKTAEEKKKEEQKLSQLDSSIETLDFLTDEIMMSELDYVSELLSLQERLSSPCKAFFDSDIMWRKIFSNYDALLVFHTTTIGDEIEQQENQENSINVLDVFFRHIEGFSQMYLKFFIDYKNIILQNWKDECQANSRLQCFVRILEERSSTLSMEELIELKNEIKSVDNNDDSTLLSLLMKYQKPKEEKNDEYDDCNDENNNLKKRESVMEYFALPAVRLDEYRELFNKLSNFIGDDHKDYNNLQTIIASFRSLNEQKELFFSQ